MAFAYDGNNKLFFLQCHFLNQQKIFLGMENEVFSALCYLSIHNIIPKSFPALFESLTTLFKDYSAGFPQLLLHSGLGKWITQQWSIPADIDPEPHPYDHTHYKTDDKFFYFFHLFLPVQNLRQKMPHIT